jgi:transcription elongation factor Elf1
MSNCPYCNSHSLTEVDETTLNRKRPENHTTMQCDNCEGYFISNTNGKSYPFVNRTDKNDDPVIRIK